MSSQLKPLISIVTPVYGCSTSLVELCFRLKKALVQITEDFEIILVNDGSPDDAWETISKLAQADESVKGINLSRNFGQHNAIFAGIERSKGEWILVMDCDLQDMPEEIEKLFSKAQEGYDIVLGRRMLRKDSFFKRVFSKVYYRFLAYMTDTKQDSAVGNFGIYNRNVIDSLQNMKDSIRYFPAMVKWVGFKSVAININHSKRQEGKSSYSYRKLFKLGLDVVISFSEKPLKIAVKTGILFSITAIIFAIYNLIKYFRGEIMVSGWTTIIVSIWFLSGIIIFLIGILGLYIGKIFDKVKDRPLYIVKSTCNL